MNIENQDSYKRNALTVVAFGSILGTMDFGIANISFPVLTKIFQTDLSIVMWVALSYSLINICLLLILGKISDLIGRKKVYVTGLSVFTLGMLLCSLAQGIGHLILFRAIQAIGSAMIISVGTAIIADALPPKELGKGMGVIQASVSFGFIIGPVLGGLLLHWFDWRSIFYTRVPICILAVFLASSLLKKDSPVTGKIRFDIKGTLTSSSGLFFLIFGVSQIRHVGLKSPLVIFSVIFGLIILGVFIFIETRAKDPIVDLTLFNSRIFSFSSLSLFFTSMAIPAYMLLMPFYLMKGLGLTPSDAGLLMAVTPVISAVISPISGTLSDRYGAVWFALLGAIFTFIAYIFIHNFSLQTTVLSIIPVLILTGISTGTFQTANNSTIMSVVPKTRIGIAAALIATKRNVGMSLGMAIAGTIYSTRMVINKTELINQGVEATRASLLSIPLSFQNAILISIVLLFFVIISSLLAGLSQRRLSDT